MKLTLHYNPADRPEIQQFNRLIPPSEAIDHAEIKAAIERFEKAREGAVEARTAAIEAEQALPNAEKLDAIALADAMERSGRDPGANHREKQLAMIADLRRRHAAAVIALERAVAGVSVAFEQHGDEVEASLSEEGEKLRQEAVERLEEWERLHAKRQRVAANLDIGPGHIRPASGFLNSIAGPAGVVQVTDTLAKLKALGAPAKPKARQEYEHRLHPGQTLRKKVVEDRRHPGQTVTLVDGDPGADRASRERAAHEAAVNQAVAANREREAWREERLARADAVRAQREEARAAEREALQTQEGER